MVFYRWLKRAQEAPWLFDLHNSATHRTNSQGVQKRQSMLRLDGWGTSGRVRRVIEQSHPAWLAASSLLGLLSLGDALVAPGPTSLRTLLAAVCVGALSGALVGLGVTVLLEVLRRAPAWIRNAAWPVAGSLLAFWMCESLAAFNNLGGPYDKLARAVIKGSAVLAIGAGLAGWLVQPTPDKPEAWLGRLRGIWRALLILASIAGAIALSWADRQGRVIEYPSATWLLRWLSFSAGVIAALGLLGWASPWAERVNGWLQRGVPWATLAAASLSIPLVGKVEASRLLTRPFSSASLEVLRLVTDIDGDGQSSLFEGGDCRPFDSRVGPHQRELPDNRVDDNCRIDDLSSSRQEAEAVGQALLPSLPAPSLPPSQGESPLRVRNVVYITVDTVGAASLHTYGYHRATTPRLDAWAKNAVIFEEAYTCGSSTSLALGGTFRGVYPRRLSWSPMVKGPGPMRPLEPGQTLEKGERGYRLPFRDPRPTLPQLLTKGDLRTFAVGPTHFVHRAAGLVGTFEHQLVLAQGGSRGPDDKGATTRALAWLRNMKSDDRYFMWVHYLGPHSPSTKAKGVKVFGESPRDWYDHELSTFDARVAPLLHELTRRQKQGESLAVIVSADHGEEFMAHRFHGHSVSDRVAHIPLIVSVPGIEPRRTAALASSVDIYPTVLSLLGLPIPGEVDGRDLTSVLQGGEKDWSRVVFTDGWVNDARDRLQSNQVVATDGHQRLTFNFTNMAEELIELQRERNGFVQENLLGLRDDSRLRAALNLYLEQAAVDPRTD